MVNANPFLRGKTISGCIACLGCVKDNVCKVDAGRLLGQRLREGHDRRQVAAAMQKQMMARMEHSA